MRSDHAPGVVFTVSISGHDICWRIALYGDVRRSKRELYLIKRQLKEIQVHPLWWTTSAKREGGDTGKVRHVSIS